MINNVLPLGFIIIIWVHSVHTLKAPFCLHDLKCFGYYTYTVQQPTHKNVILFLEMKKRKQQQAFMWFNTLWTLLFFKNNFMVSSGTQIVVKARGYPSGFNKGSCAELHSIISYFTHSNKGSCRYEFVNSVCKTAFFFFCILKKQVAVAFLVQLSLTLLMHIRGTQKWYNITYVSQMNIIRVCV